MPLFAGHAPRVDIVCKLIVGSHLSQLPLDPKPDQEGECLFNGIELTGRENSQPPKQFELLPGIPADVSGFQSKEACTYGNGEDAGFFDVDLPLVTSAALDPDASEKRERMRETQGMKRHVREKQRGSPDCG